MRTPLKFLLSAVAGLSGAALLGAGTAHADLISIGMSQTATPPSSTLASGNGTAVFNGSFGTFSTNVVTAVGTPPLAEPTLNTTSIDVKTVQRGPQTLYVWITEQGLSSPAGIQKFVSGFTSNLFSGKVQSVTEKTYLDVSNALWGTGFLLGSKMFTSAPDHHSVVTTTPPLAPLYSITAEYIVHMSGAGSANDTINIAAVPEPVSLALLGTGVLGLGLLRRKSR